jgi:serine/threonine protein kinase
MVMEYAGGGDLLHFVKRKRRLVEEEAKHILRQVQNLIISIRCAL